MRKVISGVKKVLVAEDEVTNTILLKKILSKAGYSVVVAHNGFDALKYFERERFDALLTDWMMPQIDGIELIRRVRQNIKPAPVIMMVTALVSESAKTYALESGADDFITKPINVEELISRLNDALSKKAQPVPVLEKKPLAYDSSLIPPFLGVGIASSTGGPPALMQVIKHLSKDYLAAYFIVQHGPPWMLETFSQRLQKETDLNVGLASNGLKVEIGNIYVAPGDKHMRIEANTFRILLDDGPKENFVRPSADPLFRSIAQAFGSYSVAVVLTGLGRDGAQGAGHITGAKGLLIIQDPESAVAPSMPKTTLEMGYDHKMAHLKDLGHLLNTSLFSLNAKLKSKSLK